MPLPSLSAAQVEPDIFGKIPRISPEMSDTTMGFSEFYKMRTELRPRSGGSGAVIGAERRVDCFGPIPLDCRG
jgi:hypothetical protein